MILGIGTDLCSIERITHLRNQFPIRFEAKILTKKEQKELFYRSDKNAYIAKRFAAKEAIYKAFSFIKQNKTQYFTKIFCKLHENFSDEKTNISSYSINWMFFF